MKERSAVVTGGSRCSGEKTPVLLTRRFVGTTDELACGETNTPAQRHHLLAHGDTAAGKAVAPEVHMGGQRGLAALSGAGYYDTTGL